MEFDSWRHQTHQPPSAPFNHMSSTMDPYMSSFYGSQYFPGYGVGDATWSNGGDPAMTFLGNYGGGMAPGVGGESGVPPPGAPYTVAGGVDSLGQATMFSSGGFGAFGQPAGYGFDFHGAGGVNGYSQWGQVPGGSGAQYRGPDLGQYQQQVEDRRVPPAEQAMQGLSLVNTAQQPHEQESLGPKIGRAHV